MALVRPYRARKPRTVLSGMSTFGDLYVIFFEAAEAARIKGQAVILTLEGEPVAEVR